MSTPDPHTAQPIVHTSQHRRVQLVWIVPVIAALIGLWLAVKSFVDRGPAVSIEFQTAEGLEIGKTRLKFKEVDIGVVNSIELSKDRKHVLVKAQLAKDTEGLLVDDTRFWVVRPRFSGGQASGLTTLLSGSYIGVDPGKASESRREFTGLETPPLVTRDRPGRQFLLKADDVGSFDVGSPVYYRRVQVGEVIGFDLDPNGKGVNFNIFVNAPYDKYVFDNTRFWNASGVDVSVDASGVRVRAESVVSILLGGISFQTAPDAQPSEAALPDAVFRLYGTRDEAFQRSDTAQETYVLAFESSVRDLAVGAPVEFRGVIVGEVARIGLDYDENTLEFRTPVVIHLYPERVRARFLRPEQRNHTGPSPLQTDLQRWVDKGLRAQLRTANLLTGQQYVALDMFKGVAPVKLDSKTLPPRIPTLPSTVEQLQDALTRTLKRIDGLPLEQLSGDLRRAIGTLDKTLRDVDSTMQHLDHDVSPELRDTLAQAKGTLAEAERVLAADSPAQSELRETLKDVSRAAQSLQTLADSLDRHPEALLRGKPQGQTP